MEIPAWPIPLASATAADLEAPGRERWEVVGGELVEKARPDFEHGQAQGTLRAMLGPARRGAEWPAWWLGLSVRVQLEPHGVYLPDIAGWRRDRHAARPSGRPVLAIPDWVCEVLSDSTRRRDLGDKLPVYHRRKVEHAWLVDPDVRLVQVLRWTEPGYVLVRTAGPGDTLRAEPFDALDIDVAELFGDPAPGTTTEPPPTA